MALEEWEAAGLYDADHPGADLRRRMVAYFEEVGLTPADFPGETVDSDIGAIANRRLTRSGEIFNRAQALEASGLTLELFDRVTAVIGHPVAPEARYTQADVDSLAAFGLAAGTFSEPELLHFVRVISASLARTAEAAISLFHIDFGPAVRASADSEIAMMRKNREAAELLKLLDGPLLSTFALQLQLATERSDLTREFGHARVEMAVGFVDLVGFTGLTADAPLEEVTRLIRRFEELAYDVVGSNGGQVVKLIGDEVMFVAVEPDDAWAVATALVEAFSDSVAIPRAGLAFGDLITFGGDYYGPTVNLASRVSGEASAGQILVTDAFAAASTPAKFEQLGDYELKGFPQPVPLFRIASGD